ncbi:MAG: hypothetical protein H6742_19475 [Alphaproteobacteria bacterium]|nr:hypothetical protein [Alphaproteobacteria bacterium]
MSLDLPTTRALLPCYICGDLPPHIHAAVEAALAEHPELLREVDDLRDARDACRVVMEELAGEVPELAPLAVPPAAPPVPAEPVPPLRVPFALGIAAAALLAVVGMARMNQRPDGISAMAAHHGPLVDGAVPQWFDQTDSGELRDAFLAAGVPPTMAVAPNLDHLGMRIVGGAVVPGDVPGAVVVYEDDQGRRYACQMVARPAPAEPPQALSIVAGHVLRGFQRGDTAVVVWEIAGMVCLFSADMPLDQLMAAVERRIGGAG